ncbi:hypothetical protein [Rhodophyticola sp. CCM32]|uniref:hypothetical protein n=1 Tax=Rhodophyticola sp. CCM32 TaxID=2916397 RepID=UPI00143DA479|nr:hypothetical protein [Rhodophyticola sp. CCM32]
MGTALGQNGVGRALQCCGRKGQQKLRAGVFREENMWKTGVFRAEARVGAGV